MRGIFRTNPFTRALLVGVLLLTACTTTPTKPPEPSATKTTAEQAERSGDYVRAAEEYARAAAEATAADKVALQLKAVATLLKAGQLYEARQKIQGVETAGLDIDHDGQEAAETIGNLRVVVSLAHGLQNRGRATLRIVASLRI